jgi:hypothetical protein
MFRQYGILEMFRQCGILEMFRQYFSFVFPFILVYYLRFKRWLRTQTLFCRNNTRHMTTSVSTKRNILCIHFNICVQLDICER